MNFSIHTKKYAQKGFTMVETLVAITILVVAITGPLTIISQALKASYFARDKITAYYLAQEAVEFIRNQRDKNGLQARNGNLYYSSHWLDGVAIDPVSGISLTNTYPSTNIKAELVIDSYGNYVIKQCYSNGTANVCPHVKYDPNGVYPYGSQVNTADSVFTREITLSTPPPSTVGTTVSKDRELVVYVKVSWNTAGISNSVDIREQITNWQLEKQPS